MSLSKAVPDFSPQSFARLAGFTLVATTLLGFVNTFFVKKGFSGLETFAADVFRFRVGLSIDLTMFLLVIVMAWAFHRVTKPVNESLAAFGLIFRAGEGFIGCTAVCFGLIVFPILGREWPAFDAEQLRTLGMIFVKLFKVSWNVLYILMSMGAFAYMWLLHRARMVPRWLTAWGLFTYTVMFCYGFGAMLFPDPVEGWIFVMFPGALFELLLGLWLLAKGVALDGESGRREC
ncbi:MAG: DUF4386 domain-containing protein [Nibricoccus sp.]